MKQILSEIIPEKQKEVKEFRAKHGGFVVGDVSVDMVRSYYIDLSCMSDLFVCVLVHCLSVVFEHVFQLKPQYCNVFTGDVWLS